MMEKNKISKTHLVKEGHFEIKFYEKHFGPQMKTNYTSIDNYTAMPNLFYKRIKLTSCFKKITIYIIIVYMLY